MAKNAASQERIESLAIQEALAKSYMFLGFIRKPRMGQYDLAAWRDLFRSHVARIDAVRPTQARASERLQQHLLEAAAFSIAVIASIRSPGTTPAHVKERKAEVSVVGDAIRAARKVQNFLWGSPNGDWGIEEWRRMLRKRVAKLDEVDPTQPHAAVELQKRLLQTAALGIALVAVIRMRGVPWKPRVKVPSSLPQYRTRVKPR